MSPLCDVEVEEEEMIKKREKAIEERYKTMEKFVKIIVFSRKKVSEQSLEGIFENMAHELSEQELLEQAAQVNSVEEFSAWEQRCVEFIESLQEKSRVKRPRLSIGRQQSLVAQIARIESAKTQLQRRFIHIGGEYAAGSSDDNAQRLVWREIDTAFESRILTGNQHRSH